MLLQIITGFIIMEILTSKYGNKLDFLSFSLNLIFTLNSFEKILLLLYHHNSQHHKWFSILNDWFLEVQSLYPVENIDLWY